MSTARGARDGPQRRTMQVVEMRVRDQHGVDRRQVGDAQSRAAQALEYEQPAREIGIDDEILATKLHEEAGMSDEGDAHLSRRGAARACVWFPCGA